MGNSDNTGHWMSQLRSKLYDSSKLLALLDPDLLDEERARSEQSKVLLTELMGDITYIWQSLCEADSQPGRRSLVRAISAFFDGHLNCAFEFFIKKEQFGQLRLLPGEREVLCQSKAEIKDNGKARIRVSYAHQKNRVLFASRLWCRFNGNEVEGLDKNCPGWKSFEDFTEIRNRLVHPRRPMDLDVKDEDVNTVFTAIKWYSGEFSGVLG